MKAIISKIHARFRQLRNGEVADNLTAQGVRYRLAWGVESYRLKAIAEEVREMVAAESDSEETVRQGLKQIAETLLNEDVRESKMLATRLYPIELLTMDRIEDWASGIRYTEQADQACMNLFSRLPFARTLVDRWIGDNGLKLYMALHTASRLEINDNAIKSRAEQIASDPEVPMYIRCMANNML